MIKSKTVYYSQYDDRRFFDTTEEAEEYDDNIHKDFLGSKLHNLLMNIELPEWYFNDMYNEDEISLIKNCILENWQDIYDIMEEKPEVIESDEQYCENCKHALCDGKQEPCASCTRNIGNGTRTIYNWEPKL